MVQSAGPERNPYKFQFTTEIIAEIIDPIERSQPLALPTEEAETFEEYTFCFLRAKESDPNFGGDFGGDDAAFLVGELLDRSID